MIQMETGNALAVGKNGGLAQSSQLATIDEGFQNVLLDIQVVVHNGGKLLAEVWEVVDGFFHRVVGHVVGGGLGTEQEMIANVLFDEAGAVVAADDGIG